MTMRLNALDLGGRTIGAWLMRCLVLGALALGVLGGCAQSGGTVGKDGEQIYTESDEPVNMRRARVRMELASNYFQTAQYTVALDEVKQALALDPRLTEAYNLRGLIYMAMSENRLAEDSFRRALTLKPNDGDTLHNWAWFLCQNNRHGEASAAFSQAIAAPGYGGRNKSLMVQGLCEIRAGRPDEAERTLFKAQSLDPNNPIIGYNLAQLLYQRGDLAAAQRLMRRLNATDMANAETLWLGIRIERKLGQSAMVTQWGQQLRRQFGDSKQALLLDRGVFDD